MKRDGRQIGGDYFVMLERREDQELRETVWRLGRQRPCSWRRVLTVYLLAAIALVLLLAATADGADCCLPGQPCATTPAWQGTPIGVAMIARTRIPDVNTYQKEKLDATGFVRDDRREGCQRTGKAACGTGRQ